jgi:uncharacterized protein
MRTDMDQRDWGAPERKFQSAEPDAKPGFTVVDGQVIEGYASVFGKRDQAATWCCRGPMPSA